MDFRTKIDIQKAEFTIEPQSNLLFLGSCFADQIGKKFLRNAFNTTINPIGTLYNPASIYEYLANNDDNKHYDIAFITLGTTHIYRLKSSGEIVTNCQKRPANLFQEERLSLEECTTYLHMIHDILRKNNEHIRIIYTVSPIRYAKYGFHESQISKATLLMAVEKIIEETECTYFPAYEIMLDELRDYRFWAQDMLHPTQQAVDYIWECIANTYFSKQTLQFLEEWKPICEALAHKPFNPESLEYKQFLADTMKKKEQFENKWLSINRKP